MKVDCRGCRRTLLRVTIGCLAVMAISPPSQPALADDATTIQDALRGGSPVVQLRYRVETVSDDAPAVRDRDAWASTLRTVIGYRTLAYRGVSAFAMFENVTSVGRQLYNNLGAGDLANGVTSRPVVADPEINALNQAYLDFAMISDTRVRFGRDELAFDDQRFVGPVGWRQHHQSFDAASAVNTSIPDVTVTYAYVWNVHRIFGDNMRMGSHLVHARYAHDPRFHVSGFYDHLDYDRMALAALSTGTVGVRIDGVVPFGDWRLPYDASFANQRDVGDNPASVDASYLHVEAGVGSPRKLGAKAGIEVLGADPGAPAFATPLATLHKFNGFADKFLATPSDGLRDVYVQVAAQPGEFDLQGVFHWFSADEGDAEYGTELDVLATYKSPWGPVLGFKGAIYNADTYSFDTRKLMLWAAYTVR